MESPPSPPSSAVHDALKLPPKALHSLLERPIGSVFSPQVATFLERNGISTILDLLMRTPESLLSIKNIGEKTLERIFQVLESIGFYRSGRGPRATEVSPPAILPPTGLRVETDVQS